MQQLIFGGGFIRLLGIGFSINGGMYIGTLSTTVGLSYSCDYIYGTIVFTSGLIGLKGLGTRSSSFGLAIVSSSGVGLTLVYGTGGITYIVGPFMAIFVTVQILFMYFYDLFKAIGVAS